MSKKRIISITTIIVLLFVTGIAVGVFLYGREETQATGENQTIDENQVTDGNQSTDKIQPGENSTQDQESPDKLITPGEEAVGNNETVENVDNQTANNNNITNTQGNVGNNGGITTNTNVDYVGETTISRVEEQERLISEDFLDWWQPMTLSVKPTELGVKLPQVSVKKSAITGVGEDKFVYVGQNITYVIAVTNNSETAVENIEVTDRIPENTTYVEESIEDAFIVRKVNGEFTSEIVGTKSTVEVENKVVGVKWVVSIPAGETMIARFTVNVNEMMIDAKNEEIETSGTILNNAIANGEKSNEVKTSIIRTHKSSVIMRNDEIVETAKIGDLITYTISIENTGDVEGTTYIIDEVPAGTQFVSAEEVVTVSEEKDSMVWSVTVPAHTTITREFTVEVINVEGLIKNVADVSGTPTNEDIIDTANIDVIKTATAVKRAGEEEFTTPVGKVKENDIIQYTIVVTNTGSIDLTNVLLEEQLEGIEVTKIVVDNIEKAIEKDAETGKLIIGELRAQKEATEEAEAIEAGVAVITAEYKVSYEKDIKGQGNEDGTQMPIYNKVIVAGVTVPDTENPDEVPEEVEDNDDEIVPVAPDARFTIEKKAIDILGKVRPGDIVKYEIVVTNTGNTTLTNIEIRDSLDIRVTENYNDDYNEDLELIKAGDIIKTIPILVSGANTKITTYYKVNEKDMIKETETIENIAKAKTEGLEEEQDKETIDINPNTTITITKTWVDENDVYGIRPDTITVNVIGKVNDNEVKRYDNIKVEKGEAQGNEWKKEVPGLPKYEGNDIIVYSVEESNVPAGYAATTDKLAVTNTEQISERKSSIVTRKNENEEYVLVSESKNGKQVAKLNDRITYTIYIENASDKQVKDLTVTDTIPEGTELVPNSTEAIPDNGNLTWYDVDVPAADETANGTVEVTFTVEVKSIDKDIENTARVENNNTNKDIIQTVGIDVEKTITKINRGGTLLDLANANLAVVYGDVIEYQIIVTNTGTENLTNVVLEEKLEGVKVTNLVVDGKTKTQSFNNEGKLIIGDLNATKQAVITATYTVQYEYSNDIYNKPLVSSINNEVTVTGETIPDSGKEPEIVEDDDKVDVPVAGMTILKTATKVRKYDESQNGFVDIRKNENGEILEKVRPQDVIEYTITVINTGNTKLTNIKITDTLDVRVGKYDESVSPKEKGDTITIIQSLEPEKSAQIKTYYTVKQNDMTSTEKINNVATAKTDKDITDTDNEVVPVNPSIILNVNKTWIQPENTNLQLPSSITVRLYVENETITEKVPYKDISLDIKPDKNGNYFDNISNLPKYAVISKEGKIQYVENIYSVKEDAVEGFIVKDDEPAKKDQGKPYSYTQNITNTLKQEEITFSVNKIWIDEGLDKNGKPINDRPEVKVKLYKGEGNSKEFVEEKFMDKDECKFINLPKYEFIPKYNHNQELIGYECKEIIYSVEETVSKDTYQFYSKTNVTNKTTTFTNIIKQSTIYFEVTKEWNIPAGISEEGATPAKIYVVNQDKNRVTESVEISFNRKEPYRFTDLPKYQEIVNDNGEKQLKVVDGKVIKCEYSVAEEANNQYISEKVDNTTIKNTPKGIIEKYIPEITQESAAKKVDVVFVLDVSTSMTNYGRITKMKDAVNTAMNTISAANSKNRIGIVAFTSDNVRTKAKPIRELSTGTAKIEYYKGTGNTETNKGILYACTCGKDVCKCSADNKRTYGLSVRGATYTQTGIELGAEMLINDTAKDKGERTAIMILVTDGLPTVYNSDSHTDIMVYPYENRTDNKAPDNKGLAGWKVGAEGISGGNDGNCETTDWDCIYNTIRTANYWKDRLATISKYGSTKIFTLGIGLDNERQKKAALATLQPTDDNLKAYLGKNWKEKFSTFEYGDVNSNKNVANYADKAFLTNDEIDAEYLSKELIGFVYEYNSVKRVLTEKELTKGFILSDVDSFYGIKVIYGGNDVTTNTVTKIDETTYKVNLTDLDLSKKQVKIVYYEKPKS